MIGAGIGAIGFGYADYLFGQTLERMLGRVKHIEIKIMIAIVSGGILVWMLYFFRRKKEGGALKIEYGIQIKKWNNYTGKIRTCVDGVKSRCPEPG